ncbi:MAG: hypothetical protein NTW86_18325 [Candidatus Sumerlaeota bacterium]|nr:hypothetical protein [Candidatus Sumerlaeota bacterium]
MTFYAPYDPTKGTVGAYRSALGIGATGAVDEDVYHYLDGGQWVVADPNPTDDVTQEWTTDGDSVAAPSSFSASSKWDDAAVIPPGEGGNRKDGPLSKSVTILAVQGLITGPSHQWVNSAPYRLDHQGLTSGAPGSYPISFQGSLLPQHDRLRPFWEITGGGGSFQSETVYSLSPTHVPPGAAAQGATATMHVQFKNESNQWEDTGISHDVEFDIFAWHFQRDMVNESQLEQNVFPEANCGFAAHHGYDGSTDREVASPYGGSPEPVYNKNDSNMDEASEVGALVAEYASIGRVVIYTGFSHIEILTGDSGLTWGCNTPADPISGHWSASSIGLYFQTHGPDGDGMLTKIEIYVP